MSSCRSSTCLMPSSRESCVQVRKSSPQAPRPSIVLAWLEEHVKQGLAELYEDAKVYEQPWRTPGVYASVMVQRRP